MFYAANHSPRIGPMKSLYKPGAPLPRNIRKHCWIYFDEQLYISALTILSDVLTSSAFTSDSRCKPVFVPPAAYTELISCLLIHPRHTSQASGDGGLELSSRAICFLRTLLATAGPLNASLCDAFAWTPDVSGRGGRRNGHATDANEVSTYSENEDTWESMRGVIANNGKVRRCARDFWHAAGWAFNCSIGTPQRWRYWKIWLDYMLDVLDADLTERERLDSLNNTAEACQENSVGSTHLRNSLLGRHLCDVEGRSSAVKRVVRSVFADGSPQSLKDFPEVFPKEAQQVGLGKQKRKRKRPHYFTGGYGGYDEDDDTDDGNTNSPGSSHKDASQNSPRVRKTEARSAGNAWLGGPESVNMRQRLLGLLSRYAVLLPESFVQYKDLYDAIYICMRPLPVPAFSLLISPSNSSHFPVVALVSLTQLLLCRFLPQNAPRPEWISHMASDDLTQDVLEKCFLPFSANTSSVADNAKVSILVESAVRLFMRSCQVYQTSSLQVAAENGIVARQSKIKSVIKSVKRRQENDSTKTEGNDMVWLDHSAERIRALVSWVDEGDPTETG